MLVPNPGDYSKARIGNKDIDEVSELSERQSVASLEFSSSDSSDEDMENIEDKDDQGEKGNGEGSNMGTLDRLHFSTVLYHNLNTVDSCYNVPSKRMYPCYSESFFG